MDKEQVISTLAKLDVKYEEKGREARFWAREIYLAGTASKYVKASSRPVLEARYKKAREEEEALWKEIESLMEEFAITVDEFI